MINGRRLIKRILKSVKNFFFFKFTQQPYFLFTWVLTYLCFINKVKLHLNFIEVTLADFEIFDFHSMFHFHCVTVINYFRICIFWDVTNITFTWREGPKGKIWNKMVTDLEKVKLLLVVLVLVGSLVPNFKVSNKLNTPFKVWSK